MLIIAWYFKKWHPFYRRVMRFSAKRGLAIACHL